jgi:hypothetical protein
LNDYEITDRQIGGKRKQPKQNTQNQTEELWKVYCGLTAIC